MTRLFKLGFGFFLGLLTLWKDSILDFDCKYILFYLLELISVVFSRSAITRILSRLLHQLSYCGIFIYYTSYSVVAHFIIFTVLAIILAKHFLLKFSYFFVITCFTLDMNQSLFYHTHMYTL